MLQTQRKFFFSRLDKSEGMRTCVVCLGQLFLHEALCDRQSNICFNQSALQRNASIASLSLLFFLSFFFSCWSDSIQGLFFCFLLDDIQRRLGQEIRLLEWCGTETPVVLSSKGNGVLLEFISNYRRTETGFGLEYSSVSLIGEPMGKNALCVQRLAPVLGCSLLHTLQFC